MVELKPLMAAEVDKVIEFAKQPGVAEAIGWTRSEISPANVAAWMAPNTGFVAQRAYGIHLGGKLVGACTLNDIHPLHRKAVIGAMLVDKSLRTRALIVLRATRVLLNIAFNDLGLRRVEAKLFEGNDGIGAIAAKLPITIEGTQKDVFWAGGEFRSWTLISMLSDDWNGTVLPH